MVQFLIAIFDAAELGHLWLLKRTLSYLKPNAVGQRITNYFSQKFSTISISFRRFWTVLAIFEQFSPSSSSWKLPTSCAPPL